MAHRAKTEQCVLFYVPSRSINLTLLILNCSAHTLQSKSNVKTSIYVKTYNIYIKPTSHRSWTPLYVPEPVSFHPSIYYSTLKSHLNPLHPISITSNQLQDIYYLIERIDYGVPAYLYVYSLILQNISILLITLLFLLIQNLSLVIKLSCPSHLVKDKGVGLYSESTPIYSILFICLQILSTPS